MLGDCSRNVSLEFYVRTERDRNKVLRKLEKIENGLAMLREYIEETESKKRAESSDPSFIYWLFKSLIFSNRNVSSPII